MKNIIRTLTFVTILTSSAIYAAPSSPQSNGTPPSNASTPSEIVKSLHSANTKFAERRKALLEQIKNAKTDSERKALLAQLKSDTETHKQALAQAKSEMKQYHDQHPSGPK